MSRRRIWMGLAASLSAVTIVSAAGVAAFAALDESAKSAPAVHQSAPAPEEAPLTAGYQVYLDKQGNRIARPKDKAAPESVLPEAKPVKLEKVPLEGGGFKMNISHIRAYSVATVDASGKVSTSCETQHVAKP